MTQPRRRPSAWVLAGLLCAALAGCESATSEQSGDDSSGAPPAGPAAPTAEKAATKVWPLLAKTKLPDVYTSVSTDLAKQLGENGMVLVYVDISCPEARTAVRDMAEIRRVLGDYGVRTVLINGDDLIQHVRKTYESQRSAADVFLHDSDGGTGDAWQIDSVPTVFLFDPSGALAYRGTAEWSKLAKAADRSLGLPPGTVHFKSHGTGHG